MRHFLLLMLIGGCLSGVAPAAFAEPYPPTIVNLFNKDCAKDDYMVKVCGCVINRVQATVPLADFIEEGGKQGGIAADPRYKIAIQACVIQYPQNSSSLSSR